MLRIGSETRFAGLELSAEKRHWKLVAVATGIYKAIFCFYSPLEKGLSLKFPLKKGG